MLNIEHKGEEYELCYNETICLLGRNDTIKIKLPESLYLWDITIRFTEDNSKEMFYGKINFLENGAELLLTNWLSDLPLENTKPYIMKSLIESNKFTLYIKVRSNAIIERDFRNVTISIYKKND